MSREPLPIHAELRELIGEATDLLPQDGAVLEAWREDIEQARDAMGAVAVALYRARKARAA